jgi:pentose-5-phosphate-3-epimerase
MKISASIYSTPSPLVEVVRDLDAHRIDFFHVDCNDDPAVFDDIQTIRKYSSTPVDLHIITAEPEKYYPLLEKNSVEFLTFQHENLKSPIQLPKTIRTIKPPHRNRMHVGLAITAASEIDVFDAVQTDFDFILMMATTPGKSGGAFNTDIFRKIRAFNRRHPEKPIHVDGGVNGEVSFILRNMGVYASVSGSYLFNAPTIGMALLALKTLENASQFQVRDFMLHEDEIPVLGPQERNFEQVLQSIENGKMGFTICVDDKGKLEGLISNADIRRGILRNINTLNQISTADLLNRNPVAIEESASVADLLRLIKSKEFPVSYLPVINASGRVTGALTFFNLVKGEA